MMLGMRVATLGESRDFRVRQFVARLGNDVALMEARGQGLQEREDYVFESLADLERSSMNEQFGQVGGFDLLAGVKRRFAEEVTTGFGIQEGFIRDVIVNFIARLSLADFKSFITPGACKSIVARLAGAVQGAIVDYVLKSIGLPQDNFIARSIVEALKSGFTQEGPFVRIASETICKIKISDLLPGGKGLSSLFGGDKGAAAAAPAAAGADVTAPAT